MSTAIINALADAAAALSNAMDAIGCAMRHAAPECRAATETADAVYVGPLLPDASGKWHVIQTANGSPSYLKGPRTPEYTAKYGYGFSYNRAEAWPFDSWHEAHDAALALVHHMSWQPTRVICVQ